MALSNDEREQFLAEPQISAPSVRAGNGPGERGVSYLRPPHWISADLGAV